MKLSCSSQSLDALFMGKFMDLKKYIKYSAEELGLKYVELEDKHFESASNEYIDTINTELKKYGVEVCNIAFDCSFGYLSKEENDRELERARQWMKIGKKLGSKNFRVFAGWIGGLDQGIGKNGLPIKKEKEAWQAMIGYIRAACDYARELDLDVVIENHNHGGFLSSSEDVLRLFNEVPKDNLSLLLDTGNYVDGIPGIERTIHLVKKYVHVKINEIKDDGKDNVYDLDTILNIIKKGGFEGFLSIEYEGNQDVFTYLPKVVNFIKNFFSKN